MPNDRTAPSEPLAPARLRRRRIAPKVLGALAMLAGMTAAASGQSATPAGRPAEATDSPYVPEGYVKVFSDEFDGDSLDTSKWWTRFIYENGMLATLNDERQLYAENNNHILSDGILKLTAYHKPDLKPPRFQYESGVLRSKKTFKYGYFEARVKAPKGIGVWPGFWLNSDADADGKTQWPPEIDIYEFVNNGRDDKENMLHMAVITRFKEGEPNPWGGDVLMHDPAVKPKKRAAAHYHAPFAFHDDFHVVAGLWDTDDTVTMFVDGRQLVKFKYNWVYKDGREAPYAHVLLQLAIGGQWAGRYGIDDDFPKAFEIDYVRVYQKRGHEKVGQSTIGHDLLKPASDNRK